MIQMISPELNAVVIDLISQMRLFQGRAIAKVMLILFGFDASLKSCLYGFGVDTSFVSLLLLYCMGLS